MEALTVSEQDKWIGPLLGCDAINIQAWRTHQWHTCCCCVGVNQTFPANAVPTPFYQYHAVVHTSALACSAARQRRQCLCRRLLAEPAKSQKPAAVPAKPEAGKPAAKPDAAKKPETGAKDPKQAGKKPEEPKKAESGAGRKAPAGSKPEKATAGQGARPGLGQFEQLSPGTPQAKWQPTGKR